MLIVAIALAACVVACVGAVNEMAACPDTRMGYFVMALIWGSAAVMLSFWMGMAVTDWFLGGLQHKG